MASKSNRDKPSIRRLAENAAGSFDRERPNRNIWQVKDQDSSRSMLLRALSPAELDFAATCKMKKLKVFQPYGGDSPPASQDTGTFNRD